MRFKAVIFDLDDTLYKELDFVKGGYQRIANYLAKKYGYKAKIIFTDMLNRYESKGREKLFNYIIEKYCFQKKEHIKELLRIYRSHQPKIKLYRDALDTITELKAMKIKMGLITDGNNYVQQNKVRALKLNKLINRMLFTDKIGVNKLSAIPFKTICQQLKVSYKNACYIGDNPLKDFFWPNKLKMTTIRVKRGLYKDIINRNKLYNADYTINSLAKVFRI